MPTRCGSVAYLDRARRATPSAWPACAPPGAIIVGKATTHEFALGVTSPQSRNPHDLDAHPRRLERRIRHHRRDRHGARLARHRHPRVDPRAGRAERRRRLQADVRHGPHRGSRAAVVDDGPRRADGPHGRRRRAAARRAGRRRSAASSQWADAAVDGWRVGRRPSTRSPAASPAVAAAVDRRARAGALRSGCARRGDRRAQRPRPRGGERRRAGRQPQRGGDLPPHARRRPRLATGPRSASSSTAAAALLAVDYLDAQRMRADLGDRLLGAVRRTTTCSPCRRCRSWRPRSTTSPAT